MSSSGRSENDSDRPIADVGGLREGSAMFKNWLKKRVPHEAAWPSLPESGFMLGRVATAEDIDLGDAVFSQVTNDGLKAEPYPTTIPQYALWQDEDGSTRPVFVLQAEKHVSDPTGKPIYGLRTFDGEEIVASGEEVRLLGAVPPAT